jgi:hypothetical protein
MRMVPIPVMGSRWQTKGGWVQDPGERCNRLGIAGAGRDLVVGERDHAVGADCRHVLGRREAAQELQLLLPGGRAVVVRRLRRPRPSARRPLGLPRRVPRWIPCESRIRQRGSRRRPVPVSSSSVPRRRRGSDGSGPAREDLVVAFSSAAERQGGYRGRGTQFEELDGTAIASIETSRPRGRRTLAGAERAGGGSGMCWA